MAKKRTGTVIALASLAAVALGFYVLTRPREEAPPPEMPPPEQGGASAELILTSGIEPHSSLPADVTATVRITATGGTLPISAGVGLQILNPATNSWVNLATIGAINNITALNVPITVSRLFLPIDIQNAIGVSAGTFQMRAAVSLENIIGLAPVIIVGPVTFTLGQSPTGTVTIGVA